MLLKTLLPQWGCKYVWAKTKSKSHEYFYNAVSPKGTCIVNVLCQFSQQARTNFIQAFLYSFLYTNDQFALKNISTEFNKWGHWSKMFRAKKIKETWIQKLVRIWPSWWFVLLSTCENPLKDSTTILSIRCLPYLLLDRERKKQFQLFAINFKMHNKT